MYIRERIVAGLTVITRERVKRKVEKELKELQSKISHQKRFGLIISDTLYLI